MTPQLRTTVSMDRTPVRTASYSARPRSSALGRGVVLLIAATAMLLTGCASAPATKPTSDKKYNFWPPSPAEPRIQFVRSYALSTDVNTAPQSALDRLIFGDEADQAIAVNKPYGVAMAGGKIYVCDTRDARVTVFDLVKRETRLMGAVGFNALQAPVDVAIADDGTIYVADRARGVMVYNAAERFERVMGLPEMRAIGVAVHGPRLFIANMTGQNVVILDRRTGDMLGTIGVVGDEDGQFRLPLGLAADPQGNLHVVDVMRCRLQKFSPDGRLLAAVGEMTDTSGNFVRPKHVAVDREGLVYVVDASFQNVQVFDDQYRLLTSFGGAGAHDGAMNMPAGIFVTSDGVDLFRDEIHPYFEAQRLILVTNQFGWNKVSVYALGRLRPGRSVHDLTSYLAEVEPDTLEPGDYNPLSDQPASPLVQPPEYIDTE